MHFCSKCHNMYYLKIRDDDAGNSLIYYCRNCGDEDMTLTAENVCVSETQMRRSEQKYTYMVNEYTKYDPTLPRINTIKCPNQECESNQTSMAGGGGATRRKTKTTEKAPSDAEEQEEQEQQQQPTAAPGNLENNNREVIYIRYDDINMKYVYLCVHCDTMWKTDNRL